MSTINITIELDSTEPAFNAILVALGANVKQGVGPTREELLQKLSGMTSPKVKEIEVVGAEEVETEKPAPKRASRAKAKPAPEPEPEPEEEEENEENGPLEEESADEVTADDLRELQATKVDKNREAIKAKLAKLGATGIKNLDEEHYQAYADFLSKLK